MRTGGQLAFEHRKDADSKALARLEHNVPDESVAHDHFDTALEQIVAFDVADKIEVQLLAQFEGLARQLVPLRVRSADAEDAHAWALVAEDVARVNAAHHGVL